MGLQSQVNSLIGSVSSAISGVAQAVAPTDAETIEETTKRLEKEKLARAKQKASMDIVFLSSFKDFNFSCAFIFLSLDS